MFFVSDVWFLYGMYVFRTECMFFAPDVGFCMRCMFFALDVGFRGRVSHREIRQTRDPMLCQR